MSPCSKRIAGLRSRARATTALGEIAPHVTRPATDVAHPATVLVDRREAVQELAVERFPVELGEELVGVRPPDPVVGRDEVGVPAWCVHHSGRELRLPPEPGAPRLELGREAEERRLVAEARHQLDRDRQPFRALTERECQRGLAGDVEPHRER